MNELRPKDRSDLDPRDPRVLGIWVEPRLSVGGAGPPLLVDIGAAGAHMLNSQSRRRKWIGILSFNRLSTGAGNRGRYEASEISCSVVRGDSGALVINKAQGLFGLGGEKSHVDH